MTTQLDAFRGFLLCFGSQRGGTTWLDDQLRKHPDFHFPPRKELRFLDPIYVHDFDRIQKERVREFRRRLWNSSGGETIKPLAKNQARELRWNAKYALVAREDYNDDWYLSLFDECDRQRVTGDFSPDYSLLPEEGVARLAALMPHARLVFSMRNPVDRTLSGSSYPLRHHQNLSEDEKKAFVENAARSELQKSFSDYKSILTRFEKHFPADAIKVIFHDDVANDPELALRQVCAHVGVDFEDGEFGEFSTPINRSPKVQSGNSLREDLQREYLPLLEWLSERYGSHATRWFEEAKSVV